VDPQNQPAQQPSAPAPKGNVGLRVLILGLIGVVLAAVVYLSPRFLVGDEKAPNTPRLKMGGTSVVHVAVENRWRMAYNKAKDVLLDYESTGTTTGVERLTDHTFTVAFTHAPLTTAQQEQARAKGGDVVHVPVLLCGVAVVYNVKELKGKPPLQVTGEVLADIFMGKIKTWDDPALKKLNPDVTLPATPITVVHRKDSSGTTLLFTQYLADVSKEWKEQVGAKSEVKWPVGTSTPRNLGVAQLVDRAEGSIGYVDRLFTTYEDIKLDHLAIQNHDKSAFVRAEPKNMTEAVKGILGEIPESLAFDLANKPGKDAYPICGVIYAVCYRNQPEPQRKQVVEFLRWATHEGQEPATKTAAFAPLPQELVTRVDKQIESIQAKQ
jgi:phosphate ABC transporter phosphate-binding protein